MLGSLTRRPILQPGYGAGRGLMTGATIANNRAISSVAARMLATNGILADVMVARPELTRGFIENTSRRFGRVVLCAGAYGAEETRQMEQRA